MTEAQKALNFLASAGPLASTTVSNKDADEIMISTGGTLLGCGSLYNLKSQQMSPGVCKISLERAN